MDTSPATKEDLKKFATKTDLKHVEKNLRGVMLRVEERVEHVEDDIKSLRGELKETKGEITQMITKLQNTLDGFVGTVDDLRTENQVGAHQLRELDVRVTKLETTPHAA